MYKRDELFIGGRWQASTGAERLVVISPTTEEVIGEIPAPSPGDVNAAVEAARSAFTEGPWPRMPVSERAACLQAVVDQLMARAAEAVDLQIDEMGGTRRFIETNLRAIPSLLEQIRHDAESVPMREVRKGTAGKVLVTREPIGVVAGVVPWNSPLMAAMTKLVPSLLMGCPIVLKPAPESSLSAYVLAEAVEAADLPVGVVSVLGGGLAVGEQLVAHPGVGMVTFTGSSAAGRSVAAECGRQLKRVTCELGGKSAGIFLPDANFERFVPCYLGNCLRNVGQICISLSRALVPRDRQDELIDLLTAALTAMKVGDPHESETDVGPLAAERQRDRVIRFIDIGRREGATLALGGGRPPGIDRGWFVEPTIFADVDRSMTIARDEIFGPVLSVMPYDDVDEAVAIANDSDYGLFGSVYGEDLTEATDVALRLQTGTVAVNEGPPSGGGGPFGGWKQSGVGRERAPEGLLEFLELRSIAMPVGADVPADACC